MPPKPSTTASLRGRPAGSKNKASTTSSRAGTVGKSGTASAAAAAAAAAKAKGKGKQRAEESQSPNEPRRRVGEDDEDESMEVDDEVDDEEEEEDDPEKSIPPDLLTRILHEFFEKDGTRITKDANNAMAKYMDVFVKEAIARAAAERTGGFFGVEDLEKIAPQLLLDL